MPPRMKSIFLLAALGFTSASARLAATIDEAFDNVNTQVLEGSDQEPNVSSDPPGELSSDSNYYSPKHKGKGFNPFATMGWLSDACPGNRDSDEKDFLREGCARWSTGLEHESFLVHSREEHREEYVVNVGTVATQMARYGRVFGLDRETHSVAVYLEHTGVEFSGRSCAGINEVNFKGMAESVSPHHKQLTFDSAFCQVALLDTKIIEVVGASPGEQSISATLGEVGPPRSGMSTQLGLYTRTGGKNHICSSCTTCDLKDYTGSYHVSISLPHDPDGWILYDDSALSEDGSTCSETYVRERHDGETPFGVWVDAHMNFANMVQWIEPLLLAVFGSPDADAVCDNGEFIEGSYRTMSSGWGVPGTTDVRTFGTTGTGRYAHKGFDWLLEVVPSSDAGIFGCTEEGMGSDIRTKSSVDEHSMAPGTELPPMDVGQGLEIRVFDNFPLNNLKSVYRVIALLAENSRIHHADEYIYDNHGWKASAQEAMKEGWNAILTSEYVHSLESNLHVDLSGLGDSTQAFDVFSEVYAQLIHLRSEGFWTGLLLDDVDLEPVLDNPNRYSWESAAVEAGVTPASIRDALGVRGDGPHGMVQLADAVGDCTGDVEDLVYLAQTFSMVEGLEMNGDGSVKAAQFHPEKDDETMPMRTCSALAS